MRSSHAFAAVLALCANSVLAGTNPHQGSWTCKIGGKTPLGDLAITTSGYIFTDQATGKASSGKLSWVAETFGLQGGLLPGFGVHSGLVYRSPDQPDLWVIDLYSDIGTIANCHRKA